MVPKSIVGGALVPGNRRCGYIAQIELPNGFFFGNLALISDAGRPNLDDGGLVRF